ncbi:ABC transporter ATP-binding protein [Pectinatus haikarae]|uniref:Sulfonate transport system ATP-binding protein n=1 Tax=Pectinatus haikarae TaxID=349096 RepID=A0ABT9Y9H2_9FIRM|nr:ABC transporter ATP-binding protein [Pectinatus haikarae]MDQ0204484.1 sulfonate transport system ATP-binding protein [Pectinatus haikarae]
MAINVKNVQKFFIINGRKIEVLHDINFSIGDGQIISIVGTSGCGKSTLLKVIAGLEQSTSGSVELNGKKIDHPSEKDIGVIFQEPRLLPWSSVEKNIEFGISQTLSKSEKKKIIREHVDLVGLTGFEKALPKQLSGGMQQRVSIARSLINRPNTLLLDEPFGALDAFTKINMQKEVLHIWEKEKTTLILVTHDIDEAIFMGDKIVVLSAKPGTVKKVISVELPRPRDRTSDDFARVRRLVYEQFFPKEELAVEYNI